MSDQVTNALIAIVLGLALAVVLVVPVAAVLYRRRGRFGPRDLLVMVAATIYGLALWTYTLLPLPVEGDYNCVGRQLTPFDSIGAIDWGSATSRQGLSALVHDPGFLQIALNVVLFVPLGFFVRRVLRRGVIVATVAGFAISLLIETTQTTGVWHLFSCAYRLFDVDDLLLNTLGATAGSLVAAVFVRRRRPEVVWPTSITLGRRLLGMACDLLFVVLVGSVLVIGYRAVQLYLLDVAVDDLPTTPQRWLMWGIPGLVEALSVLCRGRTVGEWVVAVRAVTDGPDVPARVVKLVAGVGPMIVLMALPVGWSGPALMGFALVTVVASLPTREHRGLAHLLSGMRLEIARSGTPGGRPDQEIPGRGGP